MNTDLISFLKKQSHYTPVGDIEEKLELSRDAIFSDVEALIEQGYSIEFHPYLGVKLIDIPDRLLKHEIRDDLNTKVIGRKLEIHDQVASTNETAWQLIEADDELKDGTVVLADTQTQGRGRMGREWHSAAGHGLWMSVVLKVAVPPDKVAFLTAMASLAVANMLQQFIHLPAEIKWPNDVIIRGRKVCGILVEARSNVPDTFVLGIGLNVNQSRHDFPESLRETATSLRLERPGAKPLNRVRVLRPLLFYLERVYDLTRKKKWDKLAKAWSEFVHMGGKYVRLNQGAAEVEGTVVRVHPSEGITLRINGAETTISAESASNIRQIQPPAEASHG
ncbi:MAG: biotin--[acetyl-CoA-carboxylase] ligase [Planctomycetes bacterium]|nr:biotin--[acetyl-CoA-carboxylase] ligase [Planctomycetota bacterium]MCW8136737.1 biotin--[acetyl-CoA-carboxylase] ligase [Planctomycetota bacterium]